MAIRNLFTQTEHDAVIKTAFDDLDKVKHTVYTNPNQQKNTSVSGHFPDIIITDINDNNVKFIIEVETADSVNNAEVHQWKTYSELGGTFYLLVPLASKSLAEILCRQNNIKTRIGTYRFQNGSYIINYE
ncbi:MAG: hypothetical protein Q7U54_05380 [Bacteroidales bacterium]|nr:hypothetical protein [Bacteroidales bacterium]